MREREGRTDGERARQTELATSDQQGLPSREEKGPSKKKELAT